MEPHVKRTANQSVEPTGGSRFCQRVFVSQWRLPPVAHAHRSPGLVATTPVMRTRPRQNGEPSTRTGVRVALDSCHSCHSWSTLSGKRRTTNHTNHTNGRGGSWQTGDGNSANQTVEATATGSPVLTAGPGDLRGVCGRRTSPFGDSPQPIVNDSMRDSETLLPYDLKGHVALVRGANPEISPVGRSQHS